MTTPHPQPKSQPAVRCQGEARPPDFQEPVITCDSLRGRVSMIWPKDGHRFYRIVFPPGSPYVDDWAVYREHELTKMK